MEIMRKEKLLEKKQDAIDKMIWYAKMIMTDDDLKKFSLNQLETICEIMQRAEYNRESREPFYTLTACEVLQKETGKIAYFENSGEIHEETEEEILKGAAKPIYEDYKRKRG